jgi:hypothetical protein
MTKAKIFLFLTLAIFLHGCSIKHDLVTQTMEIPLILELAEIEEVKIDLIEIQYPEKDPAIMHTQNYNNISCEVVILNKMKKAVEMYIKENYPKREDDHIKDIAHHLTELCDEHAVNLDLMLAIMEIESQFNPHATNKRSKAAGLMQVMPFWAKDFNLPNKTSLYDIKTNIDSGIKIYKLFYVIENGNTKRALYRYVGGSKSYPKRVLDISTEFNKYLKELDS